MAATPQWPTRLDGTEKGEIIQTPSETGLSKLQTLGMVFFLALFAVFFFWLLSLINTKTTDECSSNCSSLYRDKCSKGKCGDCLSGYKGSTNASTACAKNSATCSNSACAALFRGACSGEKCGSCLSGYQGSSNASTACMKTTIKPSNTTTGSATTGSVIAGNTITGILLEKDNSNLDRSTNDTSEDGLIEIDEIQVFNANGVNIVADGVATASSAYGISSPSQILDNIISGVHYDSGVGGTFATFSTSDPWVRVDFAAKNYTAFDKIKSIKIWGRTECCQRRNKGIKVSLITGAKVFTGFSWVLSDEQDVYTFNFV